MRKMSLIKKKSESVFQDMGVDWKLDLGRLNVCAYEYENLYREI